MSKLSFPISKESKINDRTKKVYLSSPFPGEVLTSPEDGVVVETSKTECNGKIKIEHDIDNNTYYSIFCGVPDIQVYKGIRVNKGSLLGYLQKQTVEWTLVDDNDIEQKIYPFLYGSSKKSSIDVEPKKGEVLTPSKTEKEPDKKTELYYDKEGRFSSGNQMLDAFLNISLSPLEIATFDKSKVKKREKPDDEKSKKLNEELNRIKKLMIK